MRKENKKERKIDLDKKMPEMVAAYQAATSDKLKNEMFEKILRDCMSLINYTVKLIAFQPPITKEDLKQQAMVEFYYCLSNYRPAKNKKFTVYVITYMKMRLIKYVRKNQQIVSISQWVAERNEKIRKMERTFEKKHNRTMTQEEMEENGITKEEYYDYKTYGVGGWDDIDKHQVMDKEDIFEQTANSEIVKQIMQEVDKFKEDYKYIFNQRVIEQRTFEEIAEEMGCSRQNVHGKFVRMKNKLKRLL